MASKFRKEQLRRAQKASRATAVYRKGKKLTGNDLKAYQDRARKKAEDIEKKYFRRDRDRSGTAQKISDTVNTVIQSSPIVGGAMKLFDSLLGRDRQETPVTQTTAPVPDFVRRRMADAAASSDDGAISGLFNVDVDRRFPSTVPVTTARNIFGTEETDPVTGVNAELMRGLASIFGPTNRQREIAAQREAEQRRLAAQTQGMRPQAASDFTMNNLASYFPQNAQQVTAAPVNTVGGFTRNLTGLLNQNIGNFVPGANQFDVGVAPFRGPNTSAIPNFVANFALSDVLGDIDNLNYDRSLQGGSVQGQSLGIGNFGPGFDIFGNPMSEAEKIAQAQRQFGFLTNLTSPNRNVFPDDPRFLRDYTLNVL